MTPPRIPRGFHAWVVTTFAAELGAGVLAFALTWTASGHGPQAASAVLTLTIAPTVLLGLLGGAVADRFGPHRVMLAGTGAMMLLSAGLAVAVVVWTPLPAVLLAAAVLTGTVSAFFRPAAGVFPRLFVSDDALGAALSRVGIAGQLARTIGPPLGGLLLGALTLGGVALLDLLGSGIMLAVLLVIRPPRPRARSTEPVTLRGVASGIGVARDTGGVPALLASVAIVAGAVIPVVLLGIPLAARERGWSAAEAGLIEAGWIAGGLVVGSWFAWRGTLRTPWRPMAAGPLIVAVGLLLLALAPAWTLAAAGTVVVGVGVVVFTAHVFPTYLLLAPTTMLSRFQSLLILVQQAPQLVAGPAIGVAVATAGTTPVIAVSGLLALTASVVVARDGSLRGISADGDWPSEGQGLDRAE